MRLNGVYIIFATVEFIDGSTTAYVASVYETLADAEKSYDRREERESSVRRSRNNRFNKPIKKTTYEIQNWMVM